MAQSLAAVITQEKLTCYACAIMPDHVHLLMRKHRLSAEDMLARFRDASRQALGDAGLRPADHPVWGGPGWKVFLHHPEDVRRTIRYIDDNPLPLGRPRQRWPFVKRYDGWPLHEGHSDRSPYVRELRKVGRYP